MRLSRLVAIAATAVAAFVLVVPARAEPAVATPSAAAALNAAPENPTLVIHVDKSRQTMTVTVDSVERYVWPVSTGREGYNTPSGDFKPFRMDIDHYSEEWDNAPMPHSIFFTMHGDAIHGTFEERYLGKAVSHGCVRLSRKNAAILWRLVKRAKMANTEVLVTGQIPATPAVARGAPPAAKKTVHHARRRRYVDREPASAWSYDEAPPRYGYARPAPPPGPPPGEMRYPEDNRPVLPFPFFLFGR